MEYGCRSRAFEERILVCLLNDFPIAVLMPHTSAVTHHLPPESKLRSSTRPAGFQNFRFAVLKKKDMNKDERTSYYDLLENICFLCLAAAAVMFCSRKQYIAFTGRHKKMDHDYV